jgi:hypothetical protein
MYAGQLDMVTGLCKACLQPQHASAARNACSAVSAHVHGALHLNYHQNICYLLILGHSRLHFHCKCWHTVQLASTDMVLADRGFMSGPGHNLFPTTVGASQLASLDFTMAASACSVASSFSGLRLA